jgi:hypothetical protein
VLLVVIATPEEADNSLGHHSQTALYESYGPAIFGYLLRDTIPSSGSSAFPVLSHCIDPLRNQSRRTLGDISPKKSSLTY